MLYLTNAFSLDMLEINEIKSIDIIPYSIDYLKTYLTKRNFISAIEHQSTAEILSNLLNLHIPMNRISVKMTENDAIIVFQYSDPGLEEGMITLPKNAGFKVYKILLTS